jgi:hypothetical protein
MARTTSWSPPRQPLACPHPTCQDSHIQQAPLNLDYAEPPKRGNWVLFRLMAAIEIVCLLVELAFLFIAFVISPVSPEDLWPLLVPPVVGLAAGAVRLRGGKSMAWRRSFLILFALWIGLLILGAAAIYLGGGGSKYFFNLRHHLGGFQM